MSPWSRRRFLALFTAAILVATLVSTLSLFGWAPAEWRKFDATSRNSIVLPALVASVVAARMGLVSRRACVIVGALAAREAAHVYLDQLKPLLFGTMLGFNLGLLPGFIAVARFNTYGSTNWFALVGAEIALMALCATALTVAHAWSIRFSIVITPLATLMLAAVPGSVMEVFVSSNRSLLQPAMVWLNAMPWLGYEQTLYTSAFRSVYFGLIGVTACCTGVAVLASRRPLSAENARVPGYVAGALALCVAASTVMSVIVSAPLIAQHLVAPYCVKEARVSVCMHPAQQSLAPIVMSMAKRNEILVSAATPREVTYEQPGTTGGDGGAKVELSYLNMNSKSDFMNGLALSMARSINGLDECFDNLSATSRKDVLDEIDSRSLALVYQLEDTLVSRLTGNFNPVGESYSDSQWATAIANNDFSLLNTMTDAQFGAWYGAHRAEVASCTFVRNRMPAS